MAAFQVTTEAEEARNLRTRGEEPTVLHNNCSGKHAGMLAFALHHRCNRHLRVHGSSTSLIQRFLKYQRVIRVRVCSSERDQIPYFVRRRVAFGSEPDISSTKE